MQIVESADEAAAALDGCRFLDAEFMYRPRPDREREQVVFDYTLRSRLRQLDQRDAVLLLANSDETIDSLKRFADEFLHLRFLAIQVNPTRTPQPSTSSESTPHRLQWEHPEQWQRYQTTDRWARIDYALSIASRLTQAGYLLMPAHDAVWGEGLLNHLVSRSQRFAANGHPAAISPYTDHQHASVPSIDIDPDVIDLLNTAFGRDPLLPWKMRFDQMQAFWGKMSLMPFSLCGAVRDEADQQVWEDDLVIDGVLRRLGYGVRCCWVNNPAVYHQALPVFDRDGVRNVIRRTLHYSLNIPSDPIGGSSLNFPLGKLARLKRLLNPRFAHLNAQAEALIAECADEIETRLEQFGASWLDWGAYRHVVRVGDPAVEVWGRSQTPGFNLV